MEEYLLIDNNRKLWTLARVKKNILLKLDTENEIKVMRFTDCSRRVDFERRLGKAGYLCCSMTTLMKKDKLLSLSNNEIKALKVLLQYSHMACWSGCVYPEMQDNSQECEKCKFQLSIENIANKLEMEE